MNTNHIINLRTNRQRRLVRRLKELNLDKTTEFIKAKENNREPNLYDITCHTTRLLARLQQLTN